MHKREPTDPAPRERRPIATPSYLFQGTEQNDLFPKICRGRVLVVDDSQLILRLIEASLQGKGFEIIAFSDPVDALEKVDDLAPDVILLDIDMPKITGFDFYRQLKQCPHLVHIPVIFLTGFDDTRDVVRGLEMGAFDYVRKPFNSIELCARVGVAAHVKYLMDLLADQAMIDGLTGLYNRSYLNVRLTEFIDHHTRYGTHLALLMADVDKFKQLNDTRGHLFGDEVLQRVAATIRDTVRQSDTVARFGGEEFAVILPEQTLTDAKRLAERLRTAVAETAIEHDHGIQRVTISIGVATTHEESAASMKELVYAADRALYHAKSTGRNRVSLWNGEDAIVASGAE
ncbi:Response regulator PleD [Planctomycetes bacterium Pan216]|uniref:diguanylate cyclase n=1 Tax=Kolteria novifilia TaxID=2527975 RepID=A0A518B6F2_9BACT|nr:Response regulator PleD [Planctomycetes bacterium Pan216]